MIRPEFKKELESMVARLDESDDAERPVKQVLVTLLAAIEARQESVLWDHVRKFTWALFKLLSARKAAALN